MSEERPAPPEQDSIAPESVADITSVVVKLRLPGQLVQLDSAGLSLEVADTVVVETDRGPFVGTVVLPPARGQASESLRRVLRVATAEDLQVHQRNRTREAEAMSFCRERIRAHALPMKLVGAELTQTGSRATFYFTSAERVDFRTLVKDLARRFHTRIEMRQIGVRDAARHTGGVGICGRELCCASWLPEFKPISIRMAKDQNLTLNHEKLSGVCGRLRCCLKYEQEIYQKHRKRLPKLGKRVITPDGEGRVKDINVLQERVRVHLSSGEYREYLAGELSRPEGPPPATVQTGASRSAQPPERRAAPDAVTAAETSAAPAPSAQPKSATSPSTGETPSKSKRRRRRRRRKGRGKGGKPPSDG